MELSYFLGQLMGLSVVLFSIVGIIRPKIIKAAASDFNHESFSALVIGLIAIVVGLSVILSHNVWEFSWRVWITLLGWSSLIKGLTYAIFPEFLISISRHMLNKKSWIQGSLSIMLILGIYLTFKGFGF